MGDRTFTTKCHKKAQISLYNYSSTEVFSLLKFIKERKYTTFLLRLGSPRYRGGGGGGWGEKHFARLNDP